MDNETHPDTPSSAAEPAAVDAPMHFRFEMQLMTDEIVGQSIEENRVSAEWRDKRQHVTGYLTAYYEKHAVLPAGRHDMGSTESRNLEIGVIDFDSIRQKIRVDSTSRSELNYESPETIDAFPGYPLHREFELGLWEQAMGRNPNDAVYRLRQKLAGRLKPLNKK